MTYEYLQVQREGRVSQITLNRPEQRNPLSTGVVRELVAALRAGDDDDAVGAFLLTGAGRSFSAGADLQEFSALLSAPAPVHWEDGAAWDALVTTLPRLGKPVVAAVNGHAVAGGCGLVALCDFAIAAEGAVFGLSEINIGLFPLFILPALLRAVGRRHARDLALTGRLVGAQEAREMGLVTRVVPPERLLEEARELAASLAEKKAGTMRLGRHAFEAISEMDYDGGVAFARAIRGTFLGSSELREGIDAFLARKKD